MTYAYTGEVLLPVTITPSAASGGTVVKAHANWLVCRDICVPEEGDFQLDLPAGAGRASAQAPLFAASDRQVPRPSPWQAVVGGDGTLWVQGPELTPATVVDAWFIPDAAGAIRDSAAQPLTVWQGGFTLALRPGKAFRPEDGAVGHPVDARPQPGWRPTWCCAPPPAPCRRRRPTMTLQRMLGAGVPGRPDPQPDAVRVPGAGDEGRSAWPARGAARRAGRPPPTPPACWWRSPALGAALLAARAAGTAAGWGFQFQSPVFVAAMAWLLFAVGLNLSGVYEVGTGLMRTGQGLAARPGQLGSFFTGLLAVVVATPCTAPFMGVAIAAGLAAPPAVTMLVFLAWARPRGALRRAGGGAGAVARRRRSPGRWMEVLRQALAFPMYGASAWLLWVVSQEAGSSGVLATVAGLVLLGFAGWVLGLTQGGADRGRRIGQSAAAAALLAALAVLSGIAATPDAPAASAAESGAEPFSAARLAALRAEGRPVFVNMTAAWCVTCLVNERVAISSDAVRRAFADHHVAYLKGDWTRQDPQITDYLRENGRDGVPLYVYYPAARPAVGAAADPDRYDAAERTGARLKCRPPGGRHERGEGIDRRRHAAAEGGLRRPGTGVAAWMRPRFERHSIAIGPLRMQVTSRLSTTYTERTRCSSTRNRASASEAGKTSRPLARHSRTASGSRCAASSAGATSGSRNSSSPMTASRPIR